MISHGRHRMKSRGMRFISRRCSRLCGTLCTIVCCNSGREDSYENSRKKEHKSPLLNELSSNVENDTRIDECIDEMEKGFLEIGQPLSAYVDYIHDSGMSEAHRLLGSHTDDIDDVDCVKNYEDMWYEHDSRQSKAIDSKIDDVKIDDAKFETNFDPKWVDDVIDDETTNINPPGGVCISEPESEDDDWEFMSGDD